MQMHSLEDHVQGNVVPAKSHTGRQPAAAPTVNGCDHTALRREHLDNNDVGQILRKYKLCNVLNARTLLTAIPFTNATGPNELPCRSITGDQPMKNQNTTDSPESNMYVLAELHGGLL